MTRNITSGMATAVSSPTGDYCHLYEFQFSGGTERFTDASTDISWNSQTWTALGGHIGWDCIQETRLIKNQNVRVTLDGVDTTVITHVLGENHIGRKALIYLVHFSDGAVVADPQQIFEGYMNAPFEIIEEMGDNPTCRVRTRLVSKSAKLLKFSGIKANTTSHQSKYPGDTFFAHITPLANLNTLWGAAIQRPLADYPYYPDPEDPTSGLP